MSKPTKTPTDSAKKKTAEAEHSQGQWSSRVRYNCPCQLRSKEQDTQEWRFKPVSCEKSITTIILGGKIILTNAAAGHEQKKNTEASASVGRMPDDHSYCSCCSSELVRPQDLNRLRPTCSPSRVLRPTSRPPLRLSNDSLVSSHSILLLQRPTIHAYRLIVSSLNQLFLSFSEFQKLPMQNITLPSPHYHRESITAIR